VFARGKKRRKPDEGEKKRCETPGTSKLQRTSVGEINRERNYGANCRAASARAKRERGCKLIVDCPIRERNFIGDRVGRGKRGGGGERGIEIISLKARYTNR